MGYEKLRQVCCDYGCVGAHIPLAFTVNPITVGFSWGPGYEPLDLGRIRLPYDNGPLSNASLMRCEWQGAWIEGTFAWLIQRHAWTDALQNRVVMEARMDWPSKSAFATFGLSGGYFEDMPCDAVFQLSLTDYDSLDGLMTPPGEIYVTRWQTTDVPLPPP